MKRPSFQFYPADWQSNSNLRRCTHDEKGVWIDVMCLMHDQEEYGIIRWPLKEIAQAVGCSVAKLNSLVSRGILKGADSGAVCDAYVFVPTGSGRKKGDPATLIEEQKGPLWYSSRMVLDEYKRVVRGECSSSPKATPDSAPKGGIGASPKATPDSAPSRARASSSSSSSSKSLKPTEESSQSTTQLGQVENGCATTFPNVPSDPGHWLQWFNAEHGLNLDPLSRFDRKGFWPIATRWCKAGISLDQMQSAIAKAYADAKEPISNLPAYVDRVLASQNAPPPTMTAAAASTLGAAREIFGTEIEAQHGQETGRIIDITPTVTGYGCSEDLPRIAG